MTISNRMTAQNPGFLDPTFGKNGKIAHSFPRTNSCHATGMAVKRNGKIIVGATTYGDDGQQFGLLGLREDGSIDPEFGGSQAQGFVRGNFLPDVAALGGPVTLLKDEKILLSGYNYRPSDGYQHVLAQFLEDGKPDLDFGDGGRVIVDLPVKRIPLGTLRDDRSLSAFSEEGGATIQPDGKILLTFNPAITEPLGSGIIMRFEPDGTPDTSFNERGYVVVNFRGQLTILSGHTLQSDGKIIVCGAASDKVENGLLARYNANGQLDTSFGESGFSTVAVRDLSTRVHQVAVKPDDRLVAIGFVYYIPPEGLGTNDCVVTGFTKDGQPDYMFNRGIPLITEPRKGDCHWLGGVSSPSGTTTTVGSTFERPGDNNKSEFLVGRYLATGSLDQRFADGVGWMMISVFGSSDNAIAYALPTDGKLLVVGNSWVSPSYKVSLIRLLKS